MLKRIFLAVNLTDEVKDELMLLQEKWSLPVKWTGRENLHITLSFLQNRSEKEIEEVKRIAREIAESRSPFTLEFVRAVYGPTEAAPSMIWVKEAGSAELKFLQKALERQLMSSDVLKYAPERKSFSSHITLGRLQMFEFRRLDLEERPEINADFSILCPVSSIEIMESHLSRDGAKYDIVESSKLTGKQRRKKMG